MSRIAFFTLILAGVLLALYAVMLGRPALFRKYLARFPRSVWAGRILTAIAERTLVDTAEDLA